MPNRAMKMLLAILGGILAGLPFTTISRAAEPAKDCLTSPGQPTQGRHWYYRIDHPTKRHCWYVRAQGQAAPAQRVSSPAEPAAPPAGTPLQPSVANARAEMGPGAATTPPNQVNAPSATIATNQANGAAALGGPQMPNGPPRTLAERWLDHPNANRPAEAAPPNMVADITQRAQPTSVRPTGDSADYSVWMLVSALVGALTLVGVATAVLANFNRGIAITRHDDPDQSRSIWDALPGDDRTSPDGSAVGGGHEAPISWIRIARETQEANRSAEQVEQLLSRGARRGIV